MLLYNKYIDILRYLYYSNMLNFCLSIQKKINKMKQYMIPYNGC